MQIGICSFSFHRLMASGQMDLRGYVTQCRALGCTQLDPWSAHLCPVQGEAAIQAGRNPGQSHRVLHEPDERRVEEVAAAAKEAGLPFGTIAVDGAHIYEPNEQARRINRERAKRWLDVAARLGAKQVRIDAGGPENMPDEVFRIIVEGYRDLIARAQPLGIEILIENHWGPAIVPDNLIRLLESVDGLGLLYDTQNWKPQKTDEGRRRCAGYARATHIKTRRWDAAGNDCDEDVARAITYLREAGYQGTWEIESVPEDGDEIAGAQKTIELLRRLLGFSDSALLEPCPDTAEGLSAPAADA